MANKTRTQLKAYFETGDTPTESEFIDLIDSNPNLTDDNIYYGNDNSITARAGGGQADAYEINNKINVVATCVNNYDSIKLPAGNIVRVFIVYNNTNRIVTIYPPVGGFINNWAVNVGSNIAGQDKRIYVNYDSNKWIEIS